MNEMKDPRFYFWQVIKYACQIHSTNAYEQQKEEKAELELLDSALEMLKNGDKSSAVFQYAARHLNDEQAFGIGGLFALALRCDMLLIFESTITLRKLFDLEGLSYRDLERLGLAKTKPPKIKGKKPYIVYRHGYPAAKKAAVILREEGKIGAAMILERRCREIERASSISDADTAFVNSSAKPAYEE